MATIEQHNQERLRKPMVVEIDMSIPSDATIQRYTVQSGYKLYDSTLNNTTYPLRVLADLQDPGFKLDGTAQLYDSTVTATAANGKIGLRGNVGEPLVVYVRTPSTLTFLKSLTVRSEGAERITRGVNDIAQPVTRAVVFQAPGYEATLTFYPRNELTRVVVDSIVPGAFFEIRKDNLVSAQLELRTCLDDLDPKWEESTLDVSWLNSADIAQLLLNTPYDTPITYRAGYQDTGASADMTQTRYFYVTEAVTQQDDIVSLKAKDASHRLEGVTFLEGDLTTYPSNSHGSLYSALTIDHVINTLADAITAAGAGGVSGLVVKAIDPAKRYYRTKDLHVRTQMSLKDFLAQGMACAEFSSSSTRELTGLYYVDAGIPTLSIRDDARSTWNVEQSALSRFAITTTPLVGKIINENKEHLFQSKMIYQAQASTVDESEIEGGVIYEVETGTVNQNVDSSVRTSSGSYVSSEKISFTPTKSVFKSAAAGTVRTTFWPVKETGGSDSIFLRDEGIELNIEPFIWGDARFWDPNGGFDYIDLFYVANRGNGPNKIIQFSWKGDPRWQPRDILNIAMDDGTTMSCWIESISLKHEGGGTIADVTVRTY